MVPSSRPRTCSTNERRGTSCSGCPTIAAARSFADVSDRSVKKVPALRGRVVANLFFEDSTRTRLSFTLAAQRLSADVIDLTETGSSVSKGESIADTARNVEAMGVDAMVVRHKASGSSLVLARAVKCAVIQVQLGQMIAELLIGIGQ